MACSFITYLTLALPQFSHFKKDGRRGKSADRLDF